LTPWPHPITLGTRFRGAMVFTDESCLKKETCTAWPGYGCSADFFLKFNLIHKNIYMCMCVYIYVCVSISICAHVFLHTSILSIQGVLLSLGPWVSWRGLARTRLRMMTSFWHPWKASTEDTCTASLAWAGRASVCNAPPGEAPGCRRSGEKFNEGTEVHQTSPSWKSERIEIRWNMMK